MLSKNNTLSSDFEFKLNIENNYKYFHKNNIDKMKNFSN